MNSKIKPRDKIPDENALQRQSSDMTVSRLMKSSMVSIRNEKPAVNLTRVKPEPIKAGNLMRSNISSKGVLSPTRLGEVDRIALESRMHDALFIEVRSSISQIR